MAYVNNPPQFGGLGGFGGISPTAGLSLVSLPFSPASAAR